MHRLMAEFRLMTQNPPNGIDDGSITEHNFFEWEAAITGPEGTYFEDDVFIAKLEFPKDYPLNPPKMKFQSEGGGRTGNSSRSEEKFRHAVSGLRSSSSCE